MNTPKSTSLEQGIDNSMVDRIPSTFRRTILLSILVVVSTIIIFGWTKRRHNRLRHHGKCLLLCGLSNSGKTLLFNRLTSTLNKRTLYSQSINHGTMTLDYLSSDRPVQNVHVIEISGHNLRERQNNFRRYKASARAIIFVLDSTTIENDVKHLTDYLDDILCEKSFRDQRLPLLIFCNKQDLNNNEHNIQSIHRLLEQELTMKRHAYEKRNDETGRLGKERFQFNDIKHIRIEFVEGSALDTRRKPLDKHDEDKEEQNDNGSHLLKVHQWIARIWFK